MIEHEHGVAQREDRAPQRRRDFFAQIDFFLQREIMQVAMFAGRELQRRRDRVDGTARNRHVAALLEPRVERDADLRELRNFLAAQSRRAAPRTTG